MSISEEQLKELIRSAIKENQPQASPENIRNMMRSAVKDELASQQVQQPTESHSQHILNCPECYAETVKGIEKMKETSDYLCEDCDLPLGSKEFAEKIDACPRCGSKKAKKR